MLKGKVSSALKWLDAQGISGSLEVNEQVESILREKHQLAQDNQEFDLHHGPIKNRICNL